MIQRDRLYALAVRAYETTIDIAYHMAGGLPHAEAFVLALKSPGRQFEGEEAEVFGTMLTLSSRLARRIHRDTGADWAGVPEVAPQGLVEGSPIVRGPAVPQDA